MKPENPPRRIGLGKKVAFSIVIATALLSVAELLVAWFWTPPPPSDPYVGFSGSIPLLVPQEQVAESGEISVERFGINPAKLIWFNPQSFPAAKSPNTYRIVCLGGSTTFGRPFDDSTSFCGWLRTFLPMVDPSRNWEVINAGGISYASYRVARVMEEFSDHDVDLFILYTGQNEFLERRTYGDLIETSDVPRRLAALASKTHLGQAIGVLVDKMRTAESNSEIQLMSGEVDEILNHSIGPAKYHRDPDWYRGVENHFRINLQRMLQISEACGAKLAIVTPASNLRDCSPFKSDYDDGIDAATRTELDALLNSARRSFAEGLFDRTREDLETILQTDDANAEVHFLLGRTLFAGQQFDLAAEQFQRAIDLDICPLRATTPIKQRLRQFIAENPVIEVDFESHLSELAKQKLGNDCFGAELFLDHVHPTVDVHREIALVILKSLADNRIVAAEPTTNQIQEATVAVEKKIDYRAQAVAFRNLAKVTHWAGKFEEAKRNAEFALQLLPEDLESRFILADCLDKEGRRDEAIGQYNKLFQYGDFARACQPFGELLAAEGHYDAAKAYLMQAIFVSQGWRQVSAYESLGRLHEFLGEQDLADECFENAERIRGADESAP
ncbi:MAG: tetratricopeptide repeat protein [Planctomycetales bacterium]|nr:tetratricopeptide repeat protein [Planctomycetales bacterium]